MNRFYRFGALLLSAAMLTTSLAGCASTQESTTETTTEAATTTTTEGTTETTAAYDLDAIVDLYLELAGVSSDTVIGTTRGVDVTAAEYLYAISYVCDQVVSSYAYYYGTTELPWDEEYAEGMTVRDYLAESAASTAAFYAIIPSLAEERGVTTTQQMEDDVAAEVEYAKATLPEDVNTDYIFWQIGTTEEVYRQISTTMYLYDAMVESYIETGIDGYPSEEEVAAYVEEISPYSAKHILFKTIDDYAALSEEEIAAQLALAEDVLAQLEASSDPVALFDELMNEYSEDSRDPTTGALYSPDGYESFSGQMVSSFESAALALDDYEISGLVESEFGYHIIMRLPLEVDYDSYREEMVIAAVYELENIWMEESPIETNEAFDSIDAQSYYNNLTLLKAQLTTELQ